jgi:Flp pilus assembly protein TadD
MTHVFPDESSSAVVCASCGAKVRADRTTCPRCRSAVVRAVAGQEAPVHVSRPTVLMGAALLGTAVIVVGSAWVGGRGPEPQPAAPSQPRQDPLASRRARVEEPAAVMPESVPQAGPAFQEPQSEGAVAYSAGDYASALERYQAAIAKNPEDAEALSNLGQVLVRLGKAEEAVPYFDRAIALIPQRWAYRFNRARALGILGRTREAVNGYRDAQQLFPNDYATAFNLGLALHRLGEEAEAVEAYKKAIELEPNDATFRLALGTSLERLQRPRDAAAAYDEYLRLAPSAPDANSVRARIAQLTQTPPPPVPGQPGS